MEGQGHIEHRYQITWPYMGCTNYHCGNACFSQVVVQMWQQPWGDPSRALDIPSRDKGPLLPHKGTIILGGVPLLPEPTQLLQDSKAVTALSTHWPTGEHFAGGACLSWEETH